MTHFTYRPGNIIWTAKLPSSMHGLGTAPAILTVRSDSNK